MFLLIFEEICRSIHGFDILTLTVLRGKNLLTISKMMSKYTS